MRITDVRTIIADASFRNWVFLRIDTDEGLVGYGECTLEGRETAVVGAVADLSRQLLGQDPTRIRGLVRSMLHDGYWDTGPVIRSAVGGIEIALWDIAGKQAGMPVHRLLGGAVRDRVPVYSNAWYFGAHRPEDFAAAASRTVELGYRALKFDPFGTAGFTIRQPDIAAAIERVAAVRDAVGPNVELMIEGHGRFSVHSAIRLGLALERFDIAFFEEPVAPGSFAALRQVAEAIRVPIAAGERCYDLRECIRAIQSGGVHVLQPDVIHVGGISELLAIAAMAEAAMIPVAPHNASGPIATAATLQLAAVVPNLFIQEMFHPHDAPWRDEIATPPFQIEAGEVAVPTGPGLGITLDEAACAAHPFVARDLDFYRETSIINQSVGGGGAVRGGSVTPAKRSPQPPVGARDE